MASIFIIRKIFVSATMRYLLTTLIYFVEISLKIGQYLMKLRQTKKCAIFGPPCISSGADRNMKAYVPTVTSLIMSKVDYCNGALAGPPQYELDRVQSVVSAAARGSRQMSADTTM